MKLTMVTLGAACVLAVGCERREPQADPQEKSTGAGNPLTAPVDYLGTVGRAKQTAERTVEIVSVTQAIQMFHAQEGRYPKDLNELAARGYLPRPPAPPHGRRFEYNPATGQVRLVPQ
jgi:hypothetical protein